MSENEEKSAKAEDKPQTLIFVDILGFTAITNQYRVRVQEWYDEASGFSGASTTEIQGRINRFNTVMDKCVIEERLYGGVQAMLFSDCAFLVFDTSLRAALIAVSLMRSFILYGVPVRMGLGKGTFYNIEHSTTTNVRNVTVSKSRFIGTAVVLAHAAEQCGGKGMRIFLDASLDDDLAIVRQRIKTMPLSKPLNGVKWELDFLNESKPIGKEPEVEASDRELFTKVARMKDPESTRRVQLQYTETLKAMNRMRKANSRKPVRLNKLEYGGPVNSFWC
jgi:hypothetical protein